MPTPTYTPLATVTLGSSASSVTFSSIPATYRDLVLVIDGTVSAPDTSIDLEINNDTTAANYPAVYAYGDGSGTGSGTLTSPGIQITYTPGGERQLITTQIMDYSATDKHTTTLTRANSDWIAMWAGRWANTAAVNQLKIKFVQTRTWNAGSTFALYGIASQGTRGK